jgi:hypothetical protein
MNEFVAAAHHALGVASTLRRAKSKRPRLQRSGAARHVSTVRVFCKAGALLLTRRSVDATPGAGTPDAGRRQRRITPCNPERSEGAARGKAKPSPLNSEGVELLRSSGRVRTALTPSCACGLLRGYPCIRPSAFSGYRCNKVIHNS